MTIGSRTSDVIMSSNVCPGGISTTNCVSRSSLSARSRNVSSGSAPRSSARSLTDRPTQPACSASRTHSTMQICQTKTNARPLGL